MCCYYRKFVKGYAAIASHLNNKLKKTETKFEWNDDCENSFIRLKQALTSTPVLIFPQMDRQFIHTADWSYTAIEYSLSQIGPDGKERPVAFGGRSLHANEKIGRVPKLRL